MSGNQRKQIRFIVNDNSICFYNPGYESLPVDNGSKGKEGRRSWGNEAAEKGKRNRQKRDIPKI